MYKVNEVELAPIRIKHFSCNGEIHGNAFKRKLRRNCHHTIICIKDEHTHSYVIDGQSYEDKRKSNKVLNELHLNGP